MGKVPPTAKLEPITDYAKLKVEGFWGLLYQARKSNMQFIYARLFNIYGEGQNELNFWPQLKKAAISGEDFHMTEGMQVRDFLYIDCAVDQMISLISKEVKSRYPLVLNVGSGKGVKVIDFAREQWLIHEACGKIMHGKIKCRENEILRIVADLSVPAQSY